MDGKRYIVGVQGPDWAENARAAGWAIPARGREEKRITLLKLPPEERVHILERFPREVRGGTTLRGVSSRRLTR